MSQVKATFTGSIVVEPEKKTVGSSNVLEFPVYVNHTKKNKETGQYEPTGDTTKIRVALWREKADMADLQKGDIVEVIATLVEKEWQRKDGTSGRGLQTDWVESVVVKYRKNGQGASAPAAQVSTGWGAALSDMGAKEVVAEDAPF
jgi:single-stranded DNA-binding protein